MALTIRSALRFGGKWLLPLIPGVGETLGEQLEKVAANPDNPTAEEKTKALALLEQVRNLKPGVNSAEFLAVAAIQALCTKIVLDPAMPPTLRSIALLCQTGAVIAYVVGRQLEKKKKIEKPVIQIPPPPLPPAPVSPLPFPK